MASGSTTEEMMLPLQAAINCHWHSPQRGLRSRVSLRDGIGEEGEQSCARKHSLGEFRNAWLCHVRARTFHGTPHPTSQLLHSFCPLLWHSLGLGRGDREVISRAEHSPVVSWHTDKFLLAISHALHPLASVASNERLGAHQTIISLSEIIPYLEPDHYLIISYLCLQYSVISL